MTLELQHAKNVFGFLGAKEEVRLLRFYEKPSFKTWEDCCHIVIGGKEFTTVWQAVIAVDPDFPRSGRRTNLAGKVIREWDRIPSREVFERAVRYGSR